MALKPITDVQRVSGKQLEYCLGITAPTRMTWEKAGMPRNEDESYNIVACFRWRREADKAAAPATGEEGELDKLRAERMKRNITMADMAILEKKKETIPVSDHIAALTKRCSEWQRVASQLPGRNAQFFVGLSTLDKAREMLMQFCKEIADVWVLTDEEKKMKEQQPTEGAQ